MKTQACFTRKSAVALLLAAVSVPGAIAQTTTQYFNPGNATQTWSAGDANMSAAATPAGPYTNTFNNNLNATAELRTANATSFAVGSNLSVLNFIVNAAGASNVTINGGGNTITMNGSFQQTGTNSAVLTLNNVNVIRNANTNWGFGTSARTIVLGSGTTVTMNSSDGFAGLNWYTTNSSTQPNLFVNAGASFIGGNATPINLGGVNAGTNGNITVDGGTINFARMSAASSATTGTQNATAMVTINSGTLQLRNQTGGFTIGGAFTGTNATTNSRTLTTTLNLNGGEFITSRIIASATGNFTGTLNATANFNGTTIRVLTGANATHRADFISGLTTARILQGGAIIDTNGQSATISQSFSGVTGDGGFRKIGTGVLTLTGSSTYLGKTRVDAGTLALSGTGSVAGSGVSIANGANFSVTAITAPSYSLFGTTEFDLGAADNASGLFDATGKELVFGGTLYLVIDSALDLTGGSNTYNLFDFGTRGADSTFTSITLAGTQGANYQVTGFDYATGILTLGAISSIPEPSTAAALAAVLALGVACYRRRRS